MRRVEWSEAATADIRTQVGHIALDDPQTARRIAMALQTAGAALAAFATGHPGRLTGVYEKSVHGLPYIIAYALTDHDQTVSILRVIHAARDWQDGRWPDG